MVYDLRFIVYGFMVSSLWFMVDGVRFMIFGSRFREEIEVSGWRAKGLGFRV